MEAHTYDTSFLKFKEARLDYALPDRLAKTKVIQGISLGVFAADLFCLSHWPQYDPEGGVMQSGQVFRRHRIGSLPNDTDMASTLKSNFKRHRHEKVYKNTFDGIGFGNPRFLHRQF